MMETKPLNILIISFDWRNIFETNLGELKEKLERDRLAPDYNNFFLLSWSIKSYHQKVGNLETVHLKYRLSRLRIIYDFLTILVLPFVLWKRKFKPDLIFLYEFPFAFSTILPKLLWKSRVALLLGALPSGLATTRKHKRLHHQYQQFSEFLAKFFIDHFFAIGTATKDYLVGLGIKGERVKIIELNAIKKEAQRISLSRPGWVRAKYQIPLGKKILLSVGRLEPEKGFDRLIELFASLKREDLVLVIAGDGVLRASLIKKAEEQGVKNSVIFAGWVNKEEVWNYYRDADIFILLSLSEGLGLVFFEAMHLKVPVIGSRVGGIVDTIGEKEERGFFWQEGLGVTDFATIIESCLKKTPLVEEKIAKAFEYIEKKSAVEQTINQLL